MTTKCPRRCTIFTKKVRWKLIPIVRLYMNGLRPHEKVLYKTITLHSLYIPCITSKCHGVLPYRRNNSDAEWNLVLEKLTRIFTSIPNIVIASWIQSSTKKYCLMLVNTCKYLPIFATILTCFGIVTGMLIRLENCYHEPICTKYIAVQSLHHITVSASLLHNSWYFLSWYFLRQIRPKASMETWHKKRRWLIYVSESLIVIWAAKYKQCSSNAEYFMRYYPSHIAFHVRFHGAP